jgi:PmbA protein
MEGKNIVDAAVKAMLEAGADMGQASFSRGEKTEFNIDAGAMSLLRTTAEASLVITAYSGGKKGSSVLNQIDADSIRTAAGEAVVSALASKADAANGIAPASPPASFSAGDAAPDCPAMYDRLREFLGSCAKEHPNVKLEQCILDFTATKSFFANSNGASLDQSKGLYSFVAIFTAKEGAKASSFNYSGASRSSLDLPLLSWGTVGELMRQSAEQLEAKALEGKFEGDMIIAPHCLGEFLYSLESSYLGDRGLIGGSSPYKDSLGKEIASSRFSLRSAPVSGAIQDCRFFTEDGFLAEDCLIIEKGVLRNYFLSLYGSNKTGLARCPSGGGCLTVDAGSDSLADLIGGIERGVLLNRFSGGNPSEDGDFSGVAKNSYLIEKGRIVRPLAGTMVSGNIVKLLKDIDGVSRERVDFGTALFPWIRARGVTVSGS